MQKKGLRKIFIPKPPSLKGFKDGILCPFFRWFFPIYTPFLAIYTFFFEGRKGYGFKGKKIEKALRLRFGELFFGASPRGITVQRPRCAALQRVKG
jgi:hypothetical protein